MVGVRVLVKGKVQGVGFRWFVRDWAERLGVVGYVRNLPDGRVEARIEGDPDAVETMLEKIRRGPSAARVDAVHVTPVHSLGQYSDFRITFF